jgi:hypothetical protein
MDSDPIEGAEYAFRWVWCGRTSLKKRDKVVQVLQEFPEAWNRAPEDTKRAPFKLMKRWQLEGFEPDKDQ